ncbi:hypothetical protein SAMN04488691_1011177 [Haloferax larsenii]|uniref:Uncharacterized protein n=1 Tax=Haloferax larsenii TaxID=302484 RepID=A0A1H7JGK7_HALLR|nr:hypothetical protein SAMN04488691_1011177 [Haloferax larsenii]
MHSSNLRAGDSGRNSAQSAQNGRLETNEGGGRTYSGGHTLHPHSPRRSVESHNTPGGAFPTRGLTGVALFPVSLGWRFFQPHWSSAYWYVYVATVDPDESVTVTVSPPLFQTAPERPQYTSVSVSVPDPV